MSGEQRKTWTSRIGFVLASAGAAVGLGAIWKFPYMAGTNGGSAFLFPYILMTLTVGAALLIAEVALGRAGRGGIVTAYRNLAGRAWVPAGYLGVLTGFLVLCFYSAIGGWTLAYFAEAVTGSGLIYVRRTAKDLDEPNRLRTSQCWCSGWAGCHLEVPLHGRNKRR